MYTLAFLVTESGRGTLGKLRYLWYLALPSKKEMSLEIGLNLEKKAFIVDSIRQSLHTHTPVYHVILSEFI